MKYVIEHSGYCKYENLTFFVGQILSRFDIGQIEGGKTTFVMRSLNRMAKRSILRSDGSTCIDHDMIIGLSLCLESLKRIRAIFYSPNLLELFLTEKVF